MSDEDTHDDDDDDNDGDGSGNGTGKPKPKRSLLPAEPPTVITIPQPAPPAPDVQAAEASRPKVLPYVSPSIVPPVTTAIPTAAPIAAPRPALRKHGEEVMLAPIELRDPPPPPGAEPIPYGRGITGSRAGTPIVPSHRPAAYVSPDTAMPVTTIPVTPPGDMRVVIPPTTRQPPSRTVKDPTAAAIDEAVAGLGPPESIVDAGVEVYDEATRQFWSIGMAASQPLSVIKMPQKYLRYAGYYRVSICPPGDGFTPTKTRSFTYRAQGPERPSNWFFDETDVGGTVYGDRGGFMGFGQQPVMPAPQPDLAETVVRNVKALKEVEKIIRPDDDSDRKRVDELEAELRQSRMGGHLGSWAGGGWGGPGGMYYQQQQRQREEEEKRRLEEQRRIDEQHRIDEQRRLDEERRRVDEERRREEDRRREEERRAEEKRREEDRRREEEHRRELAELKAALERQNAEAVRRAEDADRRREEAEKRAAEREREAAREALNERRLEETKRAVDLQIAEIRRQNELLLAKMDQQPKETTADKLLAQLPTLLLEWKRSGESSRAEQLENRRMAMDEARLERERAREDSARQSEMWQRMSAMQTEALKSQSEAASRHSQTLLEIMGKNGSSDILNSVASAMRLTSEAQTNVLTTALRSGLGGGNSGGPSPWVDVAAGAIEAAGNIATSVIAAKVGAPPEAMRAMMGLGDPNAAALPPPPVRKPQQARPQPQQAQPQQPQRVVIPRAPTPAPAPVARTPQTRPAPTASQPQAQPQPQAQQAQPQAQPQTQQPPKKQPGMPQNLVKAVLASAQAEDAPEIVARKLFSLVETCEVNQLHIGNEDAERMMALLTTEAKLPEGFHEFFTENGGVDNQDYLDAIREVYTRLIYAYVAAVQGQTTQVTSENEDEEEDDGSGNGDDIEAADDDEAPAEEEPEEQTPPEPEPEKAPEPVAEPPAPEPAPVAAPPPQPEPEPTPKPRRRRVVAPPPETPEGGVQ